MFRKWRYVASYSTLACHLNRGRCNMSFVFLPWRKFLVLLGIWRGAATFDSYFSFAALFSFFFCLFILFFLFLLYTLFSFTIPLYFPLSLKSSSMSDIFLLALRRSSPCLLVLSNSRKIARRDIRYDRAFPVLQCIGDFGTLLDARWLAHTCVFLRMPEGFAIYGMDVSHIAMGFCEKRW